MYDHTVLKNLQIVRSDVRPYIKWAVSLVFAYSHFNIPLGCEWVYMDSHTHSWPLRVNTFGPTCFGVSYNHTTQITRSDIRPHIKWAVRLVIACGHLIFLRGLCGYVCVNILM